MFGTYQRLGLHVSAPARAVIAAARLKLAKSNRTGRVVRVQRHRFYREMLAHHARAQRLYGIVS